MVRPADSIGDKWEAAYQNAIPDAKPKFVAAIPDARDNLKTEMAKTAVQDRYKTAVASAAYARSVDASFTAQNMGRSYEQRLDQIAITGLTDTAKAKMVEMTKVRRYVKTLTAAIKTAIGNDAKVALVPDLGDALERSAINANAVAVSNTLTTSSTAAEVLAAMKAKFTPSSGTFKNYGIIYTA